MDKNNGLRNAFSIAVGISMLILLLGNSASAETIIVPDGYAKIQWAIDNATTGDTIEVHGGTYYENVNVTKQLILRGIGVPVVDAGGSGSAITLAADGITLEGFTATGASYSDIYGAINEAGIKVTSNNNTLSDNNAIGNYFAHGVSGISFISSSNNLLIGNNANGNRNIGIELSSSSNNTLISNNASSNHGQFIGNNDVGPGIGISLTSSNNNKLISNNASSNGGIGISLVSSSNNVLIANDASFNGDLETFGIKLVSSNNNTLICNNASSNYAPAPYGGGIYSFMSVGIGLLFSSNNNTLIGNNASFNVNDEYSHLEYVYGYGIVPYSSNYNLIYNNIFNNTRNVGCFYNRCEVGTQIWNITKQSGTNIIGGSYLSGNFWANPEGTGFSQTCPDSNKDGICDSPNTLDSNNTDYLPLAYNIMPPAGVTYLTNDSYAMNYINWTWTDPSEPDFDHVEVYLNSVFETNISIGVQSYTATNLTPGTQYAIGIKTVDTAGNVNATLVTAVATTAADTTAPVITLLGTSPVTIEVGSVYTDAGATASDNYDGNLTASIVTANPVNTSVKSTYMVTYNVNDSSNNPAVQVTRIVNVVDTTAPVWNPVPSDRTVQVKSGFSYDVNADDQTQVNYSINDTVNFKIDQVTGLITNITALNVGTYGLNITATDTSSNSVSQIITVTVQAEPTYSVSGYVFDNNNAGLAGVSVQNGSKQSTTTGSGSYSIAGLMNGSFNFSYTKSGFETGYLEVTVNGANVANANKTIFDNTPIFITITSPKNNSVNNTGFINVTVSLDRTGTALINWDGSNEPMVGDGTHFYEKKTGLLSGNYSFRVYANDSNGVFNASETRIVTVNRTIINNTIGNFINKSTFIVNTTLEIASPSGNTTLIIPNGTNASVSGLPVTSILIDSVAKINSTFAANLASNDKFIGENVTFGPPGAVFDPPIQIRFNYTDAQIAAAGITASQLRVKFYNTTTNTWVEQTPYILNETGKYITANVSHFSTFILLGTTSPTTHSNPPSSSGGGGGGGGGGGPSGENFLNIIVKEKYDLHIYKDIVTSYKFKNINNPILSINIVGNVNAGEIGTAVEVLRNTSSLVKNPAPGNVYKNVNMWVGTSGFGTSKNIKEAVITFRVENSWISNNNMKGSGIKMVRWDGSKWDQLETSEKTKDSTYIYFEAKTDSFSSFAITGIEKKESISENVVMIEPTEPAAAIQPEEKKYDFLINWFLIIGVFFAIGLIIEMYLRMKKK